MAAASRYFLILSSSIVCGGNAGVRHFVPGSVSRSARLFLMFLEPSHRRLVSRYYGSMKHADSSADPSRRTLLTSALGAAALLASPARVLAAPPGFDEWRESFRTRAMAKGISAATWQRAMGRVEPDMSVFKQMRSQPEFHEQVWTHINRRVSDWRSINAKRDVQR